MRIAALGDLHVREAVPEPLRGVFTAVNDHADVLVLCGDLTDHGFTKEAEVLAEALAPAGSRRSPYSATTISRARPRTRSARS
jgi:Icc-related predicted phosphoesterase